LPQIVTLLISVTGTRELLGQLATARLWSSRVIAVNRSRGTSGACACAMSALVFAGLPTTRTGCRRRAGVDRLALRAKIPPLASSRSPRSMPLVRGAGADQQATLAPSKAAVASS
jgi:hypothetical protein